MDLLIRNGAVIDGASSNVYKADIGVVDDYVARVGNLAGATARLEIEGAGLVVAPGFIDPHGHSDLTALADPAQFSKIAQGYTTELAGLCGWAPFPAEGPFLPPLRREAERLGLDARWTGPADYLRRLKEAEPAINVALLAGHESLRAATLGVERRACDPDALARMRERLLQAVDAGVFGLSFGLIYPPGRHADEEELAALVGTLDPARHFFAVHLRSERDTGILAAVDEALRVARRTGVPLQISHLKIQGEGARAVLPRLVERLEAARAGGIDVTADWYPYTASATGLDVILPDWVQAGGTEAAVRKLRDPLVRQKVRAAVRERFPTLDAFERIRIADVREESDRGLIGLDLAEIWRRSGKGRDPADGALDLLSRNGLAVAAHFFTMEEGVQADLGALPWVMVGTDAQAVNVAGVTARGLCHPRTFGTAPRVLRRAFDEGGMRGLGEAVKKLSTLPAARLRLPDRGRIAAGYRADFVLFDPERVRDLATYEKPWQPPVGIRTVIVNGKVAYREGEGVVTRCGRVLKAGASAVARA